MKCNPKGTEEKVAELATFDKVAICINESLQSDDVFCISNDVCLNANVQEIAFKICDQQTRETRQLVKMISIIDLEGFSMFGGEG